MKSEKANGTRMPALAHARVNTGALLIASLCWISQAAQAGAAKPAGMAWIPAGEFAMGTNEEEAYPTERPAHRVKIDGFWMDQTEVTNAQFAAFVEATKYITVAERVPDWEELKKKLPPGTEKPSADKLMAGSLVFTPPKERPTRDDITLWWKWVAGADWRHPEGPQSNIVRREQHPVVQVAWEDAAYRGHHSLRHCAQWLRLIRRKP